MKYIYEIGGDVWGVGATLQDAIKDADRAITIEDLLEYKGCYTKEGLIDEIGSAGIKCTDALAEKMSKNYETKYEVRNGIARLPGEVFENERIEDLEKAGQERMFK